MLPGTDDFFRFLVEREQIRLRREAGLPFPWTEDQILREWKFTNVRRYHDKTSRILREKLYEPNFDADPRELLLNCALSRYFGTAEFSEAIGWRSFKNPNFEEIQDIAERRSGMKQRVFTGAYVITNGGLSLPKINVVIDYYLRPFYLRLDEMVGVRDQEGRSWHRLALRMGQMNGFGGTGFMAKEVLLDTMLTSFWGETVLDEHGGRQSRPSDYWTWTPVGPGSLRGAARVAMWYPLKFNPTETREVIDSLVESSKDANLWPTEFGPLAPTDVQFQLCEFDKYERVRLGEGQPRSRYIP